MAEFHRGKFNRIVSCIILFKSLCNPVRVRNNEFTEIREHVLKNIAPIITALRIFMQNHVFLNLMKEIGVRWKSVSSSEYRTEYLYGGHFTCFCIFCISCIFTT